MADRALHWLGVLVGTIAIAFQFWINIARAIDQGTSLIGTIIAVLSFFTILTNIFVLLVHLSAVTGSDGLAFFRRPLVRAIAVVSIAVVGLIYHFVLAQLWNPQGLQYWLDRLQHYVAPTLMVGWWLGWGRTGTLRFSDVPVMLIYPIVYLIAVLIRAQFVGLVPYPFLDYGSLGWLSVGKSALGIAVLFAILGVIAVAADRWAPRRRLAA